jgi:predicted enzyme related to lactoylglutathione lyase
MDRAEDPRRGHPRGSLYSGRQENRVGTFFNGAFSCDNLAKTYEQLKGRGVEFTQEPKQEPWGSFAQFKDSEGNTFVLGSK